MDDAETVAAEILKFHKELREDTKKMRTITTQLFDYLMLLFKFSQEKDPEMGCSTLFLGSTIQFTPTFYPDQDREETARLVAKIYELDEERRELDKKSDRVMQQVIDLLSQQKRDVQIDAALYTRLIKMDKEIRKDARSMDHFMEEVCAHCSSHLAGIFEITYED